MILPGLDFEFAPDPPVGGFINYRTGTAMGGWNVKAGTVDHVDKNHFRNTSFGNPNGPSNYVDLYGSPPGGGSPGTIQYPLTGLTAGYHYTIEFYYAVFDLPGNYSANLKVANGNWLNVNWNASNPGNIIWLKASYTFTAKASSTTLEFTDSGSTTAYGGIGVLIDDIKIYECIHDDKKPVVRNPPADLEVECDKQVPEIPVLDIQDNCDLNPAVSFNETIETIDECSKKIIREWQIEDDCKNVNKLVQHIKVTDTTPPVFIQLPKNRTISCDQDIMKAFNDWIRNHGNAIAVDECEHVVFQTVYARLPKNYCDTLSVEFIARDQCGNEISDYGNFIVQDTSHLKFINKAIDKNINNPAGIRDSLREWLSTNGFSKIGSHCDTAFFSSNFDGDSTKNPLKLTFYARDRCGNIDSCTAVFSYQSGIVECCCGNPREMNYDGLDFEISPFPPPPPAYLSYVAGNSFGPWYVANGAIDHGDPQYCGFLAGGNPNGPTYFIDLFGSPPTGSVAGKIEYLLFGLTPGYTYTIEIWYATFTSNGNFSANIQVANGAWLNETWTANNPGSVIWLKKTYSFVARASSAIMSFTDTGSSSSTYQIGMLLDDLKIFECPSDTEMPVVNNPPTDLEVECDKDVPIPPVPDVSDNCDANPMIIIKETKQTIDPCNKKISRVWTIKDACGNMTMEDQIINVIDNIPPAFDQLPQTKTVFCENDVVKEFNDWIKKNGNGKASDGCGVVHWRINYDRPPNQHCDTILTEFIISDDCGNEIIEYANFIVKDTSLPRFTVRPVNKNFTSNAGIRDSLYEWLRTFGFSKVAPTNCDTILLSSNFNGDSTENPLLVTFYAKDLCGNVDSSIARFAYQKNGVCCCGTETELFFSNLDFESPPAAPPGGWIDYSAGDNYAGWSINTGSISIHDAGHLNLGAGNPNGSTQHMDLHGFNQGSASYTLTGLTAGSNYTISFWYAIHSFGASVSARLTVNGGSLLNVSWSASNPGDVIWYEKTYEFIADGTVATMEFIGQGATPCCGMLIDDIRIFECPADNELPVVTNPPDDYVVTCEKDVPLPPVLNVIDNCDNDPKFTFKENKINIDACTKQITRTWTITDACGNKTTEDQVIDVIDHDPPVFNRPAENKTVFCHQDVMKEFNDWLNKHANAVASDDCGPVNWRTSVEKDPDHNCDTVLAEFFVTDHCGNESSGFAYFMVQDTGTPRFVIQAQNKNLICVNNPRDSLKQWLDSVGFAKTVSDCDTVIYSNNFNGDSTQNPLVITFYSRDRCGNIDSTTATFSYRNSSDTFRITDYSCKYPQSSIDTMRFVVNGCDSIVIFEKVRRVSDSTFLNFNTCDPQQKLYDTLLLKNADLCDSLVFISYTLRPIQMTQLQLRDCTFQSYTTDTVRLTGQYCDSLIITEYIPLRKDSIVSLQTTCDPAQEDTIVMNLLNSLGCDSIVIIQTQYTGVKSTLLNVSECNLTSDYRDTVIFQLGGCDSLVITNHIALPADTTRLQSGNCDPSKVGLFTTRHFNRFGCDSLVIERVDLLASDSIFISQTSCILSKAGTDVQNLKNTSGCDSIVTTQTLFVPSDTVHHNSFTCDPGLVRHDTLVIATQKCDSLIITDIVYVKPDTNYINASTCVLANSGMDTLVYITNFCDSIVIRSIQFIPSDTIRIKSESCIPGISGLDTLIFKNAGGCDSIVYSDIEFVPLSMQYQLDSIQCYNNQDGQFAIANANDFKGPLDLYINGILFSDKTSVNSLGPGQYQVFVRANDGCLSDTIFFALINPEEFITELGPDLIIDYNQTVQLKLNSNKPLSSINWSPQGITTCTLCDQVEYKAISNGWVYTLSIDNRGCQSLDSIFIRVRVKTQIYAPNVISPNGDNINDHFYLTGNDELRIELLEIYDRWGEKLFSTTTSVPNQPQTGWDGRANGEKLNPGVFIYYARILHPSGNTEILKGDFTLVR